ncbi:MAG: hypothetical protein AB4290_18115 [Spirulina sp.]
MLFFLEAKKYSPLLPSISFSLSCRLGSSPTWKTPAKSVTIPLNQSPVTSHQLPCVWLGISHPQPTLTPNWIQPQNFSTTENRAIAQITVSDPTLFIVYYRPSYVSCD